MNKYAKVILFLAMLIPFLLGLYLGGIAKQTDIEREFMLHHKQHYTNQDIEIILFGEIQE